MADTSSTDTDAGVWARTTAPQSDFSMRAVWTGLVILALGLLITFGLALVY